MNLSKVDLNLFIVFDAIYTEANLTRAGQIIGITQPAVSNALARLRETFNDPLFVRTAQGMVPTPMAQNIISSVRSALALLRVSVQESRTFTPLQANKTFRISMTDLTEAVILPPLFQRLRRQAPVLRITPASLRMLTILFAKYSASWSLDVANSCTCVLPSDTAPAARSTPTPA